MDMIAVKDEIGDALETIPGLHVYRHLPESVEPPAAIIEITTFNFDQAFQRGMARWDGLITVMVPRVSTRASEAQIAGFADGHQATSVHAVLRAWNWTTCAYARVTQASMFRGGVELGGVAYTAAELPIDIAGPGTNG